MRSNTLLGPLLIANRGEIAVRVARAAGELGIETLAVHPADDATSAHCRAADHSQLLEGRGAAAYLDGAQLVRVALGHGCTAVHPGYGFLAEHGDFARQCQAAGLVFVGPAPGVLDLFGDKTRARALAESVGVPVLPGTSGATTLEDAATFLAGLGPGRAVMVKALAGGGGRGMRIVAHVDELASAYERCASEAMAAFGNGDLYVEAYLPRARHLEVQVAGDAHGTLHLHERECSIQRRHQKLIEVAPSPSLDPELRARLHTSALTMADAVGYTNLGTFEFLVDASPAGDGRLADLFFVEANPRIQVEHTVTEQVTGIDLVQLQLQLAGGRTLGDLGLARGAVPAPRGFAVQVRVNTETMTLDGPTRPTGGTLLGFALPGGPGVRVDTYGYVGYATSPAYDSLLAKVIGWSASPVFADAVTRTARALRDLSIEGVVTNRHLLGAILDRPELLAGDVTTTFLDEHLAELLADADRRQASEDAAGATAADGSDRAGRAGARVDASDPLAVLALGKQAVARSTVAATPTPEGLDAVRAPLQGTVVTIDVAVGDAVAAGRQLAVMEAMKMEHVVTAPLAGTVRRIAVVPGDAVYEGHALLFLEPGDVGGSVSEGAHEVDLDRIRPDLAEVLARHAVGLDDHRPDAVAKRRATGQRTARENVADLVDEGSFVEYAPLVIAAQRRRRTVADLTARTPGDGLVGGIGRVNGDRFADDRSRCVVVSYDYTVLAGTQGLQNHRKKDRLFELAERWRLPIVLFSEGGGGRPGDTDGTGVTGLDSLAFNYFARLSGRVPLVGINSGFCFAGNAALLGCCDVVIATANSNIGMGGPAMIEGGGLGVFQPTEVGPMEVQVPNGVVDIAVADEAEAVAAAKQYLSYFQGPVAEWTCADQRLLRDAIPENRLRVYDIRKVIELLADEGSVLELRAGFAPGMITALARVEGRPIGIVANNPMHLGGAIDAPGSDKASRFLQLCDAFDLPVVNLCDTPGFMVGPEHEKTALVRRCCRMFVVGANITVPTCTIVLRKGYGLGAQAMAAASFKATMFTVAWPTGEFGGMGLEGAVKLGYRNELAAITDPAERAAVYAEKVAQMYDVGKAVSVASHFDIDEVIDPAASRWWIVNALRSVPPVAPRDHKKQPFVSTW